MKTRFDELHEKFENQGFKLMATHRGHKDTLVESFHIFGRKGEVVVVEEFRQDHGYCFFEQMQNTRVKELLGE